MPSPLLRFFLSYLLIIGALTFLSGQPLQYDAPLKGALKITGTFGELRSDHFHAGLDFRASINTPVHSVADGYVSRISVTRGGYGQAIYVDHPDGRRSVYAHLESLREDLLDTVRKVQYERETFSVNVRLDSTAFPVKRGEPIGGVGNRGYSFGPHLHFEIREAEGDVPLNPMMLGFDIPDTRSPQLRQLRVYELDGRGNELRAQTVSPQSAPEGYRLADTVVVRSGRIGLGIKAYDRQNAMPNWNGIYAVRVVADTTLVHAFALDRIPYAKTEYLNALTDYREWKENTSWYHRLWALTPRAMFVHEESPPGFDGTLRLLPNRPLPVTVAVRDYAGNVSPLRAVFLYRPDEGDAPGRPHEYYLPGQETSLIKRNDLELELREDALYRDVYFRYARLPEASDGYFSAVHQLHDPLTPLHGRARLAILPARTVPDSLREHVFIGRCQSDGSWVSSGGKWRDDGFMETRISSFGDYAMYLDTVPPSVAIRYFPTDLRRADGFSLLIEDNVAGGRLNYRATVDGKWVLMEYDLKNDRLTHTFSEDEIGPGTHRFELRLSDGRGNETVFARNFTR
ncbi:M23 family metallopeptidase [Lewinella sp. W8]|uniref:M23 family metallopeptidase n=1 Tax=Lewinella sp. W8 TaxID=2528208 RepID=UPI001067CC5C|nr:M23 family metallopeptidase [Lewinella sp. W8]MTB53205.1 peptidoglycan DD-metalloendopeptidase family protein [Lewinella sp. W8]